MLDQLIDKSDRMKADPAAARKPYSGTLVGSEFKMKKRSASKLGYYTTTGFDPWLMGSILPDEHGSVVRIDVRSPLFLQLFLAAALAFVLFIVLQILFALLFKSLTIVALAASVIVAYPLSLVGFRMGAKSDVRPLFQALQKRQHETASTV